MSRLRLLSWVFGITCMMLMPELSHAQGTIKVKGRITDSKDGKPLSGATIQVTKTKGTQSVIADENGRFEISALPKSRMTISMVGYKTKMAVAADREMSITLEDASDNLSDVVVIGYGTQKKELLTGSVGNIKFKQETREIPTTSLGNLLAGQVAGLNITTPSGRPGNNPGISIRQQTSWNGQTLLYVIDGKISGSGDFNNLSPNDIESISVLKDAASAAVYGSRAAAGVILVTTRKGTLNQKAQFNYSFNTGVDKRGKNADLTSAVEAMELYNRINPTATNVATPADLAYMKTINGGWGYDQLGAVFQDPYIATHNLSVSGGGAKVRYYLGGSYVKQGAFMQNLTYDKFNIRSNITADVTDNLQAFVGFTLNNNLIYEPSNTSVGDVDGIYRKQLLWQPWLPIWTNGGNPVDYGWIGNVGAEVRGDGGYGKSNNLKPILDLQLTYKIPQIPGLSASAKFNKSYTSNFNKQFIKQYDMWMMKQLNNTTNGYQVSTNDADVLSVRKSSSSGIGQPYLQEVFGTGNDYQLNLQLNYENTFKGVHHVKGWLVYERAESKSSGFSARRETFPVYVTDQWWAGSSDRTNFFVTGGADIITGRKSWVGQFFYDYAGKYLASFAYRYDGSMNFAPDKRWGLFPSGSLGWVVSKERFFKTKSIDLLKLRLSAGLVGNDGVGGWQWQQSYQTGNTIFFGNSPVSNPGVTYGALVNPNLTWEKSFNYNAGVDVNFLTKFNASVEYWFTRTYDILGARIATVPPTFARSLPASNYGEMQAHGFELSVGYTNNHHGLRYYVNANAAYSLAKITKRDLNITYPYDNTIGQSTTRMLAYQADKILRTQADLDAFIAANPNYKFNGIAPALGQLVYKDISGPNGKSDGVIDAWDVSVVKKDNNPVIMGLNLGVSWKGLSVDATFNGYLHYSRFVNNLVAGNVEWNRMWRKWYTDGWTPNNPNGALPRRYSINDGTNSVTNTTSTFWLKSANFLRLKSLVVSYSLPKSVIDKIGGFTAIQFYCSGSNLFILSQFNKEFYDPEIGDGFSYPVMKSFNAGVNITF